MMHWKRIIWLGSALRKPWACILRRLSWCGGLSLAIGLPVAGSPELSAQTRELVIVVGAAGDDTYQPEFALWAQRWRQAGHDAGFRVHEIGGGVATRPASAPPPESDSVNNTTKADRNAASKSAVGSEAAEATTGEPPVATSDPDSQAATATSDRQRLEQLLEQLLRNELNAASTPAAAPPPGESAVEDPSISPPPRDELWIVLIGHGTFDGKLAKFNLIGPDLEGTSLAAWLQPLNRPQVIINCSSSSSPFINALSGPNRVVITATRNGSEVNFSRFGGYLSQSLSAPESDLDRDGQISLWELFVAAADQTATYYVEQSRLASEHALLDDNGDSLGTPAEYFSSAEKMRLTSGTPDGAQARRLFFKRSEWESALTNEQRLQRDQLEQELDALKQRKETLAEDAYYAALEQIMLKLGAVYIRQ